MGVHTLLGIEGWRRAVMPRNSWLVLGRHGRTRQDRAREDKALKNNKLDGRFTREGEAFAFPW